MGSTCRRCPRISTPERVKRHTPAHIGTYGLPGWQYRMPDTGYLDWREIRVVRLVVFLLCLGESEVTRGWVPVGTMGDLRRFYSCVGW